MKKRAKKFSFWFENSTRSIHRQNGSYHANVSSEFDTEANSYNDDDGRDSAQFDAQDPHGTEQLDHNSCNDHHDDGSYPRVHHQQRYGKKHCGQNANQADRNPRPEV